MGETENITQDNRLARAVAEEIEATCQALHDAVSQNRVPGGEEASRLASTVRDLCAAYRELREIDV